MSALPPKADITQLSFHYLQAGIAATTLWYIISVTTVVAARMLKRVGSVTTVVADVGFLAGINSRTVTTVVPNGYRGGCRDLFFLPISIGFLRQFPLCVMETAPLRYHSRVIGHLKWDLWYPRFKGV